ncbi:hypothetical protein [Micromonospora okii]|uniref:hypothetical protein n=1 Tax=Micromonospora okii TaxID=1182970 RepID=UPI001E2ECCA2|nr:hypothetical protein [Micromonospora okii]
MAAHRDLHLDNTLPLAVQGYGWLPNRLRRSGGDVLATRRTASTRTASSAGSSASST